MRKKIIGQNSSTRRIGEPVWLNLADLVEVEITSEDAAFPIEAALAENGHGWRAAGPGNQVIRLMFDNPQRIQRIKLGFMESQHVRTQEYVLRCSADHGQSFREIVRQQWNFSPDGANAEIEDHWVDLDEINILELSIVPDISKRDMHASLAQLRIA